MEDSRPRPSRSRRAHQAQRRRSAGSAARGTSRDEDASTAGLPQRSNVAADEVDGVHAGQIRPGQAGLVTARNELPPEDGDRPLGRLVHEAERSPLRLGGPQRVDGHTARLELGGRERPELVMAEGGEESRLADELGQPDHGHGSPARRLLPGLLRMDDLPGRGHALDPSELNPLDVTDNGNPHTCSVPSRPQLSRPVASDPLWRNRHGIGKRRDDPGGSLDAEGGGMRPRLLGWGLGSSRGRADLARTGGRNLTLRQRRRLKR